MDISKRSVLKAIFLGLGATLVPYELLFQQEEGTFLSHIGQEFLSEWLKIEKILPEEFLIKNNRLSSIDMLKKHIINDFKEDNIFIFKGIYYSKTEAALFAHAHYLRES
jgi:hypothetical protein